MKLKNRYMKAFYITEEEAMKIGLSLLKVGKRNRVWIESLPLEKVWECGYNCVIYF